MTYDILKTGSDGNCVIINGEIAIDMGIPMKKLRASGYIKDLKLVLLTHAHGDHFNPATARALHQERPRLRWGCCEWMVPLLLEAGVDKRVIDVCEPECWTVYIEFDVMPCALLHDVPNCGWTIQGGNKRILFDTPDLWQSEPGIYRLFYATDTATLDGIEAKDYDLYMIEANHTRAEIEARIADKQARGEFAYEYRAAQNHLSQEQALEWLVNNISPERWNRTEIVFLHQHKDKEAANGLDTP